MTAINNILWLYNESFGLFAPIRIISVVLIERSYLFSLVLAFYTLILLLREKDVLRSYFIQCLWMFTIICCCADTLHMWCRCLAHMVRRVNTTCAEGKIHHDIRMTGDELWAKCCNTKNTQEVCRILFSSNSFILCRLIRLHLFSHKAIKHRNAGKEKNIYPHDSL